jgi:hypothetical protein
MSRINYKSEEGLSSLEAQLMMPLGTVWVRMKIQLASLVVAVRLMMPQVILLLAPKNFKSKTSLLIPILSTIHRSSSTPSAIVNFLCIEETSEEELQFNVLSKLSPSDAR